MKQNYAQVKIQVIALWDEINQKIQSGHTISSIYTNYIEQDKIACSQRQFYKQVKKLQSSPEVTDKNRFTSAKGAPVVAKTTGDNPSFFSSPRDASGLAVKAGSGASVIKSFDPNKSLLSE